ncbi:T9SS type A sorting domain-containing protein, partial [bacterium]|nr:T9SS type A sorting domain-containing protein [bacterium]
QNYPNPFNPETWIPFQLEKDADVSISIYSMSGELVKTLYLGKQKAGFYSTKPKSAYWDGRDNLGEKVSSGVYFYTLQAGDFRATNKMVIMK